jgi:hypothetical protein
MGRKVTEHPIHTALASRSTQLAISFFGSATRNHRGFRPFSVAERSCSTVSLRLPEARRSPLSLAALRSLREEHERTIVPAQALAAESKGLEHRISDLVNEAYGLTPEEVRLMWQTAPPRVPIAETTSQSEARQNHVNNTY